MIEASAMVFRSRVCVCACPQIAAIRFQWINPSIKISKWETPDKERMCVLGKGSEKVLCVWERELNTAGQQQVCAAFEAFAKWLISLMSASPPLMLASLITRRKHKVLLVFFHHENNARTDQIKSNYCNPIRLRGARKKRELCCAPRRAGNLARCQVYVWAKGHYNNIMILII